MNRNGPFQDRVGSIWDRSRVNIASVDFTVNLTQDRVFIDRFYRINHTKTYNFHAPTLVASASHKITAKMRYSLQKITAFDEETTLRHTFLSSRLAMFAPWRSQNSLR